MASENDARADKELACAEGYRVTDGLNMHRRAAGVVARAGPVRCQATADGRFVSGLMDQDVGRVRAVDQDDQGVGDEDERDG